MLKEKEVMTNEEIQSHLGTELTIAQTEEEYCYTTKGLADRLKTTPNVITENAKKCLPYKIIVNGKPTYWTEREATVLIDWLKHHQSDDPRKSTYNDLIIGTRTSLSDDFEYFKLQAEIDKLQKLKTEYQEKRIAELENKIKEDAPKIKRLEDFLSVKNCMNIRDCANYIGIKETEFVKLLKTKYIYKNTQKEYRFYSGYGSYFSYRPFVYKCSDGKNKTGNQVMLTMEGIEFFKNKILKEGEL